MLANQPAVALVHASRDWYAVTATHDVFNGTCSHQLADANHAVVIVGWVWAASGLRWMGILDGVVGRSSTQQPVWLDVARASLWRVAVAPGRAGGLPTSPPRTVSNQSAARTHTPARSPRRYTPEHWIIKNSWGTKWGKGGFMRLPHLLNGTNNPCGLLNALTYPVIDGGELLVGGPHIVSQTLRCIQCCIAVIATEPLLQPVCRCHARSQSISAWRAPEPR